VRAVTAPRKRAQAGNLARRLALLLVLVVTAAFFALRSPFFLTGENLLNVALQSATNMVLAVGMTMVVAAAGIDLSVGSLLAVAGVAMGLVSRAGGGPALVLVVGLASGLAGGLVNGGLIAGWRIPPFIATLAVASAARGLALIATGTRPIYGMPSFVRFIGAGKIGPIPMPVVVAGVVAAAGYVLMTHTQFGVYTLAIGGNEEALRLSGVHTGRWKVAVYGVAGLLCGVASIIVTARLNTAEPLAGTGFELDAIAATVMGGTSLAGGTGRVGGTVIAALILGVLRNGLTLLNVASAYQQVALGAVIVLAVLFDRLRESAE
jgi:ribose/xylose/arabinose/galactoside ABC-type transport system permease subunit